MLVNAMPSVITVSIFSLVWQYNDSFYSRMFTISADILLSKKIGSLSDTIANSYKINDPTILQLYTYAGVILMIIPVMLIYVLLQRNTALSIFEPPKSTTESSVSALVTRDSFTAMKLKFPSSKSATLPAS